MKTVFILNPMAGKKNNTDKLSEQIKCLSEKHGKDAEIYVTKCVGDAENFVRKSRSKDGFSTKCKKCDRADRERKKVTK